MTDWEEVRENIERALEASKEFQQASAALLVSPEEKEIQKFAEHMAELQSALRKVMQIIDVGSPVALDELVEGVTNIIYGNRVRYRMTPDTKGSTRKG